MALLRRVYLPRKLFKNVLLKDIADSKVNNGALEAVTRDLLLIASLILAASVPTIIVVPFVDVYKRQDAAKSRSCFSYRLPQVPAYATAVLRRATRSYTTTRTRIPIDVYKRQDFSSPEET